MIDVYSNYSIIQLFSYSIIQIEKTNINGIIENASLSYPE